MYNGLSLHIISMMYLSIIAQGKSIIWQGQSAAADMVNICLTTSCLPSRLLHSTWSQHKVGTSLYDWHEMCKIRFSVSFNFKKWKEYEDTCMTKNSTTNYRCKYELRVLPNKNSHSNHRMKKKVLDGCSSVTLMYTY